MAYILWTQNMSVGVDMFDHEHQELIDLANKLYTGVTAGNAGEALAKVLDGLIRYTALHFKHEEDYMRMYDYPEYEAHKKEHDKLVAQVMEYKESLDSGKASFTLELMNFLKEWLVNHIMGSDQKYGTFFKDKGVQ